MNNVKTLKEKLRKSEKRSLLLAAICGSNSFVSKALGVDLKFTNASLSKWKKEWREYQEDTEKLESIANNAIMSLNETRKGKTAPERAKNFLTAFTSLTFESKDEIEIDDYFSAVCQLRLLQKMILPKERVVETSVENQTNSTGKIKNFVAGDKGMEPEPQKNFLFDDLEASNKWAENVETRSDDEKQKMDNDEAQCANSIISFINADDNLKQRYSCRLNEFANWTAEQIYGLKPEIVDAIHSTVDSNNLVANLFEQYIEWMKNNDANGYIEYLRDSTKDIPDEQQSNNDTSKNNQCHIEDNSEEQNTSNTEEDLNSNTTEDSTAAASPENTDESKYFNECSLIPDIMKVSEDTGLVEAIFNLTGKTLQELISA